MSDWLLVVLVLGVNSAVWGTFGLLRLADEGLRRLRAGRRRDGVEAAPPAHRLTTADIAVLMAAHDEELVIAHSLAAITALVPAGNVHVVSDFSTDATAELARAAGVQVLETATNVGKAGALQQGIDHFGLAARFGAVLVLDADTQLDPAYFDVALPMFDDPRVAAVAGCAETRWNPAEVGFRGAVVVAHRQRVYTLTQRLLKYGQTWRGMNATHIVPGFASMYRASVLEQIEVNPSGLVIEDFNMTFELHAKQLGRVAFSPRARAYTQDPSHYRDYVKQTSRWALGLWQTLRRHRPRRGTFAVMLAVLIAELLTSSLMFVVLPLVLLLLGGVELAGALGVDGAAQVADAVDDHVGLVPLLLAVVVPDYLLTCAVALVERRPRYLYLGLFFLAMRVTDAVIALRTLPRAWATPSTGQWVSPTRRAMVPDVGREPTPESAAA